MATPPGGATAELTDDEFEYLTGLIRSAIEYAAEQIHLAAPDAFMDDAAYTAANALSRHGRMVIE